MKGQGPNIRSKIIQSCQTSPSRVKSPLLTSFHKWDGKPKALSSTYQAKQVTESLSLNPFLNIITSPTRNVSLARLVVPRAHLLKFVVKKSETDLLIAPSLDNRSTGTSSYAPNSRTVLQSIVSSRKDRFRSQLIPVDIRNSENSLVSIKNVQIPDQLVEQVDEAYFDKLRKELSYFRTLDCQIPTKGPTVKVTSSDSNEQTLDIEKESITINLHPLIKDTDIILKKDLYLDMSKKSHRMLFTFLFKLQEYFND
ncbi:BA75_04102T0 [Komagataella pastoris]|uniref:Required for respiratory growth protein 8, mitochondrial n=1 Tax=Komagataella pastoris TaxID=4922 RepID=A0A1B2JG94_PICPA|nr:BA75_04102T0 [Komagataella pastoris]